MTKIWRHDKIYAVKSSYTFSLFLHFERAISVKAITYDIYLFCGVKHPLPTKY